MCGCGTDQRDADRWLVDLHEERDLRDETAFTSRRISKGPSTGPWGTPESSSNGLIKDQHGDGSRTSGREESGAVQSGREARMELRGSSSVQRCRGTL